MYRVHFSFEYIWPRDLNDFEPLESFESLINEAAKAHNCLVSGSGYGFGERDLSYDFEQEGDAKAFCVTVNQSKDIAERWSKISSERLHFEALKVDED